MLHESGSTVVRMCLEVNPIHGTAEIHLPAVKMKLITVDEATLTRTYHMPTVTDVQWKGSMEWLSRQWAKIQKCLGFFLFFCSFSLPIYGDIDHPKLNQFGL